MKDDPVNAWFEGVTSIAIRAVLGLSTIAIGFTVCVLVGSINQRMGGGFSRNFDYLIFKGLFAIFAYWNNLGAWSTLGAVCFLTQWIAFYVFTVLGGGKTCWFLMAAASLTLYFPIALDGDAWGYLVVGFTIFALFYWRLSLPMSRLLLRLRGS